MLGLDSPVLDPSLSLERIHEYVEFDLATRAKLPVATFKDFQGNAIPFCYPFRTCCSLGMKKLTHQSYFNNILTFMVDETKTWSDFAKAAVDKAVLCPGTYLNLNYVRGGDFADVARVFAATWLAIERTSNFLSMQTMRDSAKHFALWGGNAVKEDLRVVKRNLESMRKELVVNVNNDNKRTVDDFGGIITPKKEEVKILTPSYDSLDDGYGED